MNSFRKMLYDLSEKNAQTAQQWAAMAQPGSGIDTIGQARAAANAIAATPGKAAIAPGMKSLVTANSPVGVGSVTSAAIRRNLGGHMGKLGELVEDLYARKVAAFDPSVSRMVGTAVPSMPLPRADVPVFKIPSLPARPSLTAKTAPDPEEIASKGDLEVEAMFRATLAKQAAERVLEEKGLLPAKQFRNASPLNKTAQVVGPYAGLGTGAVSAGEQAFRKAIADSFRGMLRAKPVVPAATRVGAGGAGAVWQMLQRMARRTAVR